MRLIRISTGFLYFFFIAALFAITACKNQEQSVSSNDTASVALMEKRADKLKRETEPEAGLASPATQARKVIVTHNFALEVKNMAAVFQNIIGLAEAYGGYTSETSRTRNDDGSFLGSIVMRVPPGSAGSLMGKIRGFGAVTSESSNGEDITDEYVDLDARLKNMHASEVRLQGLLARQTTKLSDVLAVERELTRVRGEIESWEARKRNWDTLTALVTVRIELTEPRSAFPVFHKVWDPIRTAFGEALEGFAGSLHAVIIFLGTILPWAIPGGFLLHWLIRFLQKKRAAKS